MSANAVTAKLKRVGFSLTKNKPFLSVFIVSVVVLVVYLKTMPPGLTWEHYGYDAGDLISCVYTWGIPHPPGTPLYVLLGQFFRYLPFFGTPAAKFNFMSIFFGWLSAVLVYLSSRRLFAKRFPAFLSTFFFAFTPLIWGQSIVAEVLTLNLFLIAASTYFLVRWEQEERLHGEGVGGFLHWGLFFFALALTNHTSSLMIAPAIFFLILSVQPSNLTRPSKLLRLALFFGLGLLPYLYLPIRAAMRPMLNWGNPSTLSNFINHITAREYSGFLFVAPSLFLDNVLRFLEAVWTNFNPVGTFLIVLGFVFGRKDRIRDFFIFAILFQLLFVFNYNIVNIETYLLPVFFYLALFLGEGCTVAQGVFETAADWVEKQNLRPLACLDRIGSSRTYEVSFSAFTLFLLNLLLLVFSLLNIPLRWGEVDLSNERTAYDFGRNTFEVVEPGSIILAEGDRYFLGLTYFSYVLYPEKDVAVLHEAFFHKLGWMLEQARRNYPHLQYPLVESTIDQEEAEQALLDFVDMNMNDRPIYLAVGEKPLDDRRVSRSVWGDRFIIQSVGPIYQIVGRVENEETGEL
ncbi:MAG: DUF2723 domain-containing protein [Patescibacteria group bacterium]|nr:DUF2723 domain-containing protein [Patescibacteria group bacterium]